MACTGCGKSENQTGNNMQMIPYAAHEITVEKYDTAFKRLWIVIIILIVALIATNAGWIFYESQFEKVKVTQENADGYNNFIGNDGDINNGEADDNLPQEENRR